MIAYFAAARIVIRDVRLAALATFALLTTFVMGFLPHIDLMHTVLLATMLAAFLWAAARVVTRGSHADYLLLGLAIGFGILSKYVFAILPVAFAVGIALTPRFRARIKLWPLIGAIALAALIIAPYAWWASAHEYSLFSLAAKVTHGNGASVAPLEWLKGAANLALALIEFVIPAALIFPLLYWRACKPLTGLGDDDDRAWLRVLEIAMIAGAAMMLLRCVFRWCGEFQAALDASGGDAVRDLFFPARETFGCRANAQTKSSRSLRLPSPWRWRLRAWRSTKSTGRIARIAANIGR